MARFGMHVCQKIGLLTRLTRSLSDIGFLDGLSVVSDFMSKVLMVLLSCFLTAKACVLTLHTNLLHSTKNYI